MSQKPSSKLIAKALPKGDRFTGQFSLPGLIPDLVRVGMVTSSFSTPNSRPTLRQWKRSFASTTAEQSTRERLEVIAD
ncbi:hypothetical protein HGG76_11775 [Ochrobactrum tritici]|uniref:Uncharacterized protein n=1 Tax=Brucella tritici TaxID=94626 RepID=A0A7X6FQI4_9HYPH|nr:hypothetical protein [Brucella tritici]